MKKRILGLLLCLVLLSGVLPAGAFAVQASAAEIETAATGEGDHTDESDPYVATTYSELKAFINKDRFISDEPLQLDSKTYYVKLGANISYSSAEIGTLMTNGARVVLDLAGYKLSCTDKSNYGFVFLSGKYGSLTINDSKRYDYSSGKWVDGVIDYVYTVPYDDRNTAAVSGNIILNGGTVINRTSSDAIHSAYTNVFYNGDKYNVSSGSRLVLNGGTLEAGVPIFLGDQAGTAINGGELYTTKGVAVYMYFGNSGAPKAEDLPVISKCRIYNKTGKAQAFAFTAKYSSAYDDSHTDAQMLADFCAMFPENSIEYIDDAKQEERFSGLTCALGSVIGPKFYSKYALLPVQSIDEVKLTVVQGSEGETIQYGAGYESDKGYTVPNYTDGSVWKYGVKWEQMKSSYVDLPCNEANTFQGNTAYRVTVKVAASGVVGYELAAPADMTATINGSAAAVKDNGDGTYDISWNFRVRHVLDSFALTILKPAKGESPSYTAAIPGTGNYYSVLDYTGNILWKNGVSWAKGEIGSADYSAIDPDEGYVFEPGEKYTVTILLTIKRTDSFMFAPVDKCTATVNGNAATVYKVPFEDNQYGVYCTFTAPGKKVIDSIEITLPEPTAGDVVPYDAAIPEGAGYYLGNTTHGTMWKNNIAWKIGDKFLNAYEENTFIAGYDYYVWIEVVLTDKEKFMFAEKEALTATINGHEVNPRLSGDDSDRCSFSYTFSVPDVIQIDTIAVTIPEPKADARLAYDSEVPEDAGYYVPEYNSGAYESGVMWEDDYGAYSPQDANFFTADKDYTVRVFVDITNPAQYEFVPGMSMEGYVNGHRADLDKISDTRYRVSYTFTVTDSSGESYTVGDVNVDGKVNNRDAMILDRYIAGWTGYDKQIKNLDAADLNRDLSITNRDAMILDRYIAGWEGYDKYIITVTA